MGGKRQKGNLKKKKKRFKNPRQSVQNLIQVVHHGKLPKKKKTASWNFSIRVVAEENYFIRYGNLSGSRTLSFRLAEIFFSGSRRPFRDAVDENKNFSFACRTRFSFVILLLFSLFLPSSHHLLRVLLHFSRFRNLNLFSLPSLPLLFFRFNNFF